MSQIPPKIKTSGNLIFDSRTANCVFTSNLAENFSSATDGWSKNHLCQVSITSPYQFLRKIWLNQMTKSASKSMKTKWFLWDGLPPFYQTWKMTIIAFVPRFTTSNPNKVFFVRSDSLWYFLNSCNHQGELVMVCNFKNGLSLISIWF